LTNIACCAKTLPCDGHVENTLGLAKGGEHAVFHTHKHLLGEERV